MSSTPSPLLLQSAADAAAAGAAPRAPQTVSPLRVLVVEDMESDFDLLVLHLRRAGLASAAERVEEESAMRAALERERWDLVIADHRLPRFSARAALAVAQSVDRDLPFIILSGTMGEDAAVEAMLAGADDYVLKDRLARLVPAIERSLRAAAERRRWRAAEEARRESEARLHAIASNLPGMVFEMQAAPGAQAWRFTFVNEGSRRLFDVEPEAFLHNAHLLLRLIAPEDREGLRATLAAEGGASSISWEGRAIVRGPSDRPTIRWVQLSASRRRSPFGEVWDGMVTDVTALKDAESRVYASREELRRLSAHLEKAKETERARVAREIHDDIGSALTGLKVDVAWLRKRFGADAVVMEKIGAMSALLDSVVQASVRIARDLRPPILDFGFVEAIEWQARDFRKRTGIACEFACDDETLQPGDETATAVFRIFQELLANVTKHAQAHKVDVILERTGAGLRLEVCDDGRGIVEADKGKADSYGIRGMRERARDLGAELTIAAAPGRGTRAVLEVPLSAS